MPLGPVTLMLKKPGPPSVKTSPRGPPMVEQALREAFRCQELSVPTAGRVTLQEAYGFSSVPQIPHLGPIFLQQGSRNPSPSVRRNDTAPGSVLPMGGEMTRKAVSAVILG